MSITHTKVSGLPNPADPTLVGGEDWDAAHTIALADGDIPGTIARDSEVTAAVAALSTVYQPLDSDLTAIAALTTTAYGRALLALANAGAGRTALGLGTAAVAATGDFDAAGAAAAAQAASQPLDSDLTSIAALTTTGFGRGLLELANAAAGRTAFGLGTAATSASTDFQPIDADLTAIAALSTTAYGRAFLALADAAAGRTALGLGTAATAATGDFDAAGAAAAAQAASQPLDADLTAIAALTPTNDDLVQRKAGAWTNRSIAQLLTDLAAAGTTFQPLDADLTALAALATTAYGRSLLEAASAAALRTLAGSVIGTDVRAQGSGDPTRASLGLATSDSPEFAGLNVGAAADTTITRTGAGDIAVEGKGLYRADGTDVAVADGGTGASTAGGARTNLGLVPGTDIPSQAAFDDHSARHDAGGADALVIDAAQATGSLRTVTTSAAQAIGTAAAGNGVAAASSNHVHPTGAGTPSTQAMGDAAATGSGPAAAMTDHKHAMPALGTTAAAIGTSAGGSATTPSKSDHVHATGAGTPSTQAFGDAAATGSGPAAAMTDHKHAMPAALSLPGAELDYVAFTSPVSITATSEATANTVVTGSAVAYDGSTIILIQFHCPYAQTPVNSGNQLNAFLYDGSSSIGELMYSQSAAAATTAGERNFWRRLTPSNASHTYSVRFAVSTGTGTVGAGAGGVGNFMPGFIRITKV